MRLGKGLPADVRPRMSLDIAIDSVFWMLCVPNASSAGNANSLTKTTWRSGHTFP